MELTQLGWNNFFQQEFIDYIDRGLIPARVALVHKNRFVVYTEEGDRSAVLSGNYRHRAATKSELPVVGDWVAIEVPPGGGDAVIHGIVPRKSGISRKAAGVETEEQMLAANIDTLFLVSGLDGDFNLRRLERYLTLAWDSGVNPVIVLNKADICDDIEAVREQVESVAFGLPLLVISVKEDRGMEQFDEYLKKGMTVSFIGSSGVGKSSIINHILSEERLKVQEVRVDDSRGRHTTTHRELIILPDGALAIDTPGMREIQLWSDESSVERTFSDIEQLAQNCKFRDCRHLHEPGCAVLEAIESGELDEKRYNSYQKQMREVEFLIRKQDQKAALLEREKWKKIAKFQKALKNNRK